MNIGMHAINNSYNPAATAHQGVSNADLAILVSQAGSSIIRVPLDLSRVGPNGLDSGAIADVQAWLQTAQQYGLKVIFEPGQTTLDLSQNGSVSGEPIPALIDTLAGRFATAVQQIYQQTNPTLLQSIQSWEVGNEPNLSYEYI